MTKRRSSSIAALVALSAAFPAGASARTLGNTPTGGGEIVGSAVSESPQAAASDGGFAWGDAGIGAAATLLVTGVGAGFASRASGRRGRGLSVSGS